MKQKKRATKERLGNNANIVATKPKDANRKYKEREFARKLLSENNVKNRKGEGVHRTRHCGAVRAYQAETVTLRISANPEQGAAALGGVQTCGSVWSCPVCAPKIAAQRGKEISRAIDLMIEDGHIPIMLTNTAWHNVEMPLAQTKNKFKQAHRYFVQSRRWRELKAMFEVEHSIKAVEVTWGAVNGWHPHQHAIIFAKAEAILNASSEALETWISDVQDLWMKALKRYGLTGVKDIALDVKISGDVKKDYLAKLGLDDEDTANLDYELSGGMNKEQGGRKIWSLLWSAWQGQEEFERLYIEYVEAMSGDNWITWSHGLKQLCKIEEIADEEAAEIFDDIEREMIDLMPISDDEMLAIRKMYAVGDLLDFAARTRDAEQVAEWLRVLVIDWNNSGAVKEHDRQMEAYRALDNKLANMRKGYNQRGEHPAEDSEFFKLAEQLKQMKKRLGL